MYPPKYRDYDESSDRTFITQKSSLIGEIIDSDSNLPVFYVDIYYSLSNKSSIANSKGQFSISKSKKPNDFLVFSSFLNSSSLCAKSYYY